MIEVHNRYTFEYNTKQIILIAPQRILTFFNGISFIAEYPDGKVLAVFRNEIVVSRSQISRLFAEWAETHGHKFT